MKRNFYILVTCDKDNPEVVFSIYSPDLEKELLSEGGSLSIDNYVPVAVEILKKHLIALKYNNNPKTRVELKHPIVPMLQSWNQISLDIDISLGCFTKTLPALGHVANLYAIGAGSFITYMSLFIAANSEQSDKGTGVLTIPSTMLSAMINILMYSYSDAGNMLEGVGRNLDELKDKYLYQHDAGDSIEIQSDKQASLRKVLSTFMMMLLVINMLIAAITIYQEVNLLVKRYLDLQNDLPADTRLNEEKLIKWFSIYFMIGASCYSNLAFQWSFAVKFVDYVLQKIEGNSQNSRNLLFCFNRDGQRVEVNDDDDNSLLIRPGVRL